MLNTIEPAMKTKTLRAVGAHLAVPVQLVCARSWRHESCRGVAGVMVAATWVVVGETSGVVVGVVGVVEADGEHRQAVPR